MRFSTVFIMAALALSAAHAAEPTALVPESPRFVAGPESADVSWSPGGGYLLVVRADVKRWDFDHVTPPAFSVVLWNQERKEAKWLMNTKDYVSGVHWMARTNNAFIRMPSFDESGATQLWRIDARTGDVRQIASIPGYADMATSPTQPLAAVYGKDDSGGYVRTLSPAGELGPAVALNEADAVALGWSADGASVYFVDFPKPPEATHPPQAASDPQGPPMPAPSAPEPARSYPAFSPATGVLSHVSERPKREPPPAFTAPFTVSTTEMKTAAGPRGASPEAAPWSPALHPLWLEQAGDPLFKRLFLAPDADGYYVSPRNDAVAYANGEGVFVVPLVAVPIAAVKKARDEAQVAELLNDGKQIAMAALMWGQDNNNEYPGAGSDMKALLTPYLRSTDVFDGTGGGFQYTFGGGAMGSIERPSEEHLGYFDGPGGRAYVFADGHVTWVPNP
jgi:prepilin-type processing-associated H-X9-DG protein